MSEIRWLHLSDLHFRPDQSYDANIVLDTLLGDLDSNLGNEFLPIDFVFITGDIAYHGKNEEYHLAAHFFDKLLQRLSLQKENLYLVPGNHDVDQQLVKTAKYIAASVNARDLTHIERRRRVAEILTDQQCRRLVLRRLDQYAEFVNEYFAGHLRFSDEEYFYSKTVKIDDAELAIYGLNSAWFCASDSNQGQLVIGERQVRAAIDQNAGATLRIALVHHPLDWLAEFDKNDSEDLLVRQCDFILHGHWHKQAFRQEKRPSGEPYIFASGAGYDKRELRNACNAVKIDLASGIGSAVSLRYSDGGGGFWSRDAQSDPGLTGGVYNFQCSRPFIREASIAATDAQTAKALVDSPTSYVGHIKKTRKLYEIFPEDLLQIAVLSPKDTNDLLAWLRTENTSFVRELIATVGGKLELALSRSPLELVKFRELRNDLVGLGEVSSEVKKGGLELLVLGSAGGEITRHLTLQIPRKDLSRPMLAEQLTFSVYLINYTSCPIRNPRISLSTSAQFLSYPYRGGAFAIEPSEYWPVSTKPDSTSVRCVFNPLFGPTTIDPQTSDYPGLGTIRMLIPWGEADSGPIDLSFAYQIESDNLEVVRGEFTIRIVAALAFEDAAVGVKTFEVPADKKDGIDTKLYAYKGQTLRFAVKGVVSLNSRHHFVNADGYMCDELGRLDQPMPGKLQQYASPGELLKGKPAGVLLGWIGDWREGRAFYVGSTSRIVAESEGNLHLAVNDLLGAYGDNSGSFTVVVQKGTQDT